MQPVRQISLRITKAAENLFIIVFQEKGVVSTEEAAEQVDATVIEETAIHQLEGELSATRQDLQSHIEQLKSLNEELQSSNEELQAANEELETSREELQSLNEELITVNSQLQGKIEEQETTNNDLNNFLASANIPTIFLDTHFRVKRFTPAMLKLIKLLPSDAGRPIADMSQENLGPDLTSDARAVIESLVPARQELELGGAWYVRTTLPYRTADNRIEGVVITYNDVTELKKSEERTRHLASFPELNPNPICEVHSSGKINFCNPATVKVLANLGMDTEDLTVFMPEDMDDILRDLEKKEEVSLYREKEIRGLVFGMTVHLAPQFNVVRIYAFDITERKRAEEALRNNEKRLNRSQAIAHLGSWELDLANNRLTWSDEVYRIFGLQPQEFGATYDEFLEAVHPDDRAAVDAAYSGSLREGRDTYEIEHRIVRKSTGEIRYVHEKCEHFRDETGGLIRSVGMVHDITERKRAEEAQGRLAAIVSSAEEAIIGKDLNGIIETWNVGAENIFGYKAEEVIGKPVSLLVPPGHSDEVPEILARIKQGEHIESFETVRMRKDGTIVPVSLTFSAIKDASGKVIGASKIAHDITERKRAEEALRKSEELFRLAVDSMPDALGIYDAERRYKFINAAGLRRMGRPLEALVGRRVEEIYDEETRSVFWPSLMRTYETGETQTVECTLNMPMGRYDLIVTFVPMLKDGQVYQVLNFTFNITERKRAEEALRASEEQFRTLADSIPNLAWWANADGYITWYNRRWYEYTGTTSEQMEGWGWQSVHDPNVLPKVLERWQASIATGEPFDMEFPLRGADGIFRSFLTRVLPLKDADGKVLRWFGTNTDISALKLAEEALRESEARFRTLFETMTEGFSLDEIILDEAGKPVDVRFLSVNPAFERHTGLKSQDLVGRTSRELFPEAEPVWFEQCGKVVLTGEPAHFEERFGPLNKWFEVSVYRTEPGRFAVVFFDISGRKQSEADVLKLSEDMATRNLELETLNKELEAFIYSVSHDLRAPLRSMTGFAKIMQEDYADKLDDQAKDYLTRIFNGSTKMTQLINDLLHLSKLSRQEVDRMDIDLSKLAEAATHNLREAEHGRNVEVLIEQGVRASVDPNLMRVVLTNLLDNAWKFTSKTENAKIEFGAMTREGTTVYFVRDNGAGFDPAFSDKMFGPFQRLHLENEFAGTGIGLAIVDRIIRRHGGKVWAEGEVGKGATVFFTLG